MKIRSKAVFRIEDVWERTVILLTQIAPIMKTEVHS